jgi:hypothetical protein
VVGDQTWAVSLHAASADPRERGRASVRARLTYRRSPDELKMKNGAAINLAADRASNIAHFRSPPHGRNPAATFAQWRGFPLGSAVKN